MWAPWSQRWQVFEAPCEVCDQVRPIRWAQGVCVACAEGGAVTYHV